MIVGLKNRMKRNVDVLFLFVINFSLASVYAQANSEIKRKIHHKIEIETAIEGMGTESPEFLKLVETCPNKAETLLIKLMHILTDKCKFLVITAVINCN